MSARVRYQSCFVKSGRGHVSGGPGVRVSVGQVLEPLSRRVDRGRSQLDSLHLVHRLDKETTGVMLLAK